MCLVNSYFKPGLPKPTTIFNKTHYPFIVLFFFRCKRRGFFLCFYFLFSFSFFFTFFSFYYFF
ncbi:hypothetical protein ES695_05655, partial [Candidatus Atribacteria bacterium 1244-E10-H5-B2]